MKPLQTYLQNSIDVIFLIAGGFFVSVGTITNQPALFFCGFMSAASIIIFHGRKVLAEAKANNRVPIISTIKEHNQRVGASLEIYQQAPEILAMFKFLQTKIGNAAFVESLNSPTQDHQLTSGANLSEILQPRTRWTTIENLHFQSHAINESENEGDLVVLEQLIATFPNEKNGQSLVITDLGQSDLTEHKIQGIAKGQFLADLWISKDIFDNTDLMVINGISEISDSSSLKDLIQDLATKYQNVLVITNFSNTAYTMGLFQRTSSAIIDVGSI